MALVPFALPVLSLCNTLGTSPASKVAHLTAQLDEAVEFFLSELRKNMEILSEARKKEVCMIVEDIEDALDQAVSAAKGASSTLNLRLIKL